MNLEKIIKKQKEDFNKKFVGLKSVGHKKIHENNHSAHDGTKCTFKCKYVNEAILDWHSSSINEILEWVKQKFNNDIIKLESEYYPENISRKQVLQSAVFYIEDIINKLK